MSFQITQLSTISILFHPFPKWNDRPEVFLTRLFSRGQCKQVIQQEKNSPVR
jgi:hypothetical protein